MGYRDIELLKGISGNQMEFKRICNKLRQYAASVASGLFSDSVLRDDEVEKAMNKVIDWLGTDRPLHSDYPWAYAKRIVANSLIDSARTRKIEGISLNTRVHRGKVGTTVRQEMAWIDEGFAKLDDSEEFKSEEESSGWRIFQLIDEPLDKSDEPYQRHKWLFALEQLFKFQWWWDIRYWADKVRGERKKRLESLEGDWEEAKSNYKEYTSKLWSKYNLIMALINNIQGASEKRIVKAYLAGSKQAQISQEMHVSEPYVSGVLNKRLKSWGWGKPDIYQARIILLTHCLADWHAETNDFKSKQYLSSRRTILPEDDFYNKMVNAPETKIYFNDLEKSELHLFIEVCYRFRDRWYGFKDNDDFD